jgi:hypothetical protein
MILAYRFTDVVDGAIADLPYPNCIANTPGSKTLSSLEWSVVALAERDCLATLRKPGRIALAIGSIFGAGHNPRLADPRLEALRRIAVLSWHHGFAVHGQEVDAFTNAGFNLIQYEILVSIICEARAKRTRRGR